MAKVACSAAGSGTTGRVRCRWEAIMTAAGLDYKRWSSSGSDDKVGDECRGRERKVSVLHSQLTDGQRSTSEVQVLHFLLSF